MVGPMKPTAIAGLALIVIGVVALIYGGITYTSRETVIDIGPIHATADRQKTMPLPPIAGAVAVAAGAALLVTANRKRAA
jgi:drug/metabolite transporter (DMT)-like permease